MKFVYRTLAILTLAMAAGLTHSYFMPVSVSFGDGDRQVRQRPVRETPPPVEGQQTEAPVETLVEDATPDVPPDPLPAETDVAEQPDETEPVAPDEPIDIYNLGDYINVPEAREIYREAHEEFLIITAFLDARFPDQYAQGHITTARRLMPHEITDGTGGAVLSWLLEQSPDFIVIYCEGGDCDASRNLARQLQLSGFSREQLHVLQPGYPAWAEAHPDLTTTGDDPGEP